MTFQIEASRTRVATTALREYWPEGPVWLLSPGCIDGTSDASAPLSRIQGYISDPWHELVRREAAYLEIDALAEELTRSLVRALNSLHGVCETERYWRIILGSWSRFFVTTVFDRFHRLRLAQEQLGEIIIPGLDDSLNVTASTTIDYIVAASDDPFNLQLYGEIAPMLNVAVLKYRVPPLPTAADQCVARGDRFIRTCAIKVCHQAYKWLNATAGRRARVVLVCPQLPVSLEARLALRSGGKCWPYRAPKYKAFTALPRRCLRPHCLRVELRGRGDLEKVIERLAPMHLPTCFVEDYQRLRNFVAETYRGLSPAVIASAAEWHFNEGFKMWAAQAQKSGTTLIAGQHGLNYGLLKHHSSRAHELSVADVYLTWGWQGSENKCRVVPAPYSTFSTTGRHAMPDKILFCATAESRYRVATLFEYERYLDRQGRFFAALPSAICERISYRAHVQTYGRGVPAHARGLRRETWDIPFAQSLEESGLVVIDNVSTTFAEALLRDVPCVLLLNSEDDILLPAAQDAVANLEAVNIVHREPTLAAGWVAEIASSPRTWWDNSARRDAVKRFLDQFARPSTRLGEEWYALTAGLSVGADSVSTAAAGSIR